MHRMTRARMGTAVPGQAGIHLLTRLTQVPIQRFTTGLENYWGGGGGAKIWVVGMAQYESN